MPRDINALIASGGYVPQYDVMGAMQNALKTRAMYREEEMYPEEVNWLRKQRAMKEQEFGWRKREEDLKAQVAPGTVAFDTLDKLVNAAMTFSDPGQYKGIYETSIKMSPVLQGVLPHPDEVMKDPKKWQTQLAASKQGIDRMKAEAGLTTAQAHLETALRPKEPKEFEPKKFVTKEGKVVWVTPGEKIPDGAVPYEKPTTSKQLPSMGNAADVTINRKFKDSAYLTDPEKHKEALEWLGTDEGLEALKKTTAAMTPSAITVIPTSEGLTQITTRGPGAGNVGPVIGGKPITSETASKIGELETSLASLQKVKDLYNPKWVGPAAGRIGAFQEKWTGGAAPDQVKFYSYVRDIQDALLRARSGAQINEQEYKRLVNFLPDPNLPERSFSARVARFEEQLNIVLSEKRKALGEAGYGTKASSKTPKEENKTINGKKYFKRNGKWYEE